MSISYRTAGAWGPGLGRNLHPDEVDENFYELIGMINDINAALPASTVSIASITQTGTDLYVHLTDLSILGPYSLPQLKLDFRGEWATSTAYFVEDVVTHNGSTYLVTFNHTSDPTSFDPGANDGMGHDYYGLILENSLDLLVMRGQWSSGVSYVLNNLFIRAGSLYRVTFGHTSVAPFDPNANDGFGHNFYELWLSGLGGESVEFVHDPAYTLVINDVAKYKILDSEYGCEITVPTQAAVPFAVGDVISFHSATTDPVTFVAESDSLVIIEHETDKLPQLRGIRSVASLKYVGVIAGMEEWHLFGSLLGV